MIISRGRRGGGKTPISDPFKDGLFKEGGPEFLEGGKGGQIGKGDM